MTPEEIQARVLYRDGLVLILDKPAGLAVHAGPGGGDNLERYFAHLRFGLPRPPALAHRLDRDTSGCLALGRHPKALRRLGSLFAEGRVEKVYWAVVLGRPAQDRGRIELALSKVGDAKGWRMLPDPAGQSSITDYELKGHAAGLSWIEFRPRTGRTHQIRVHAASGLGCPLLGDRLYGGDEAAPHCTPLHLHARSLTLPLYDKKPAIGAVAIPPPAQMTTLMRLGMQSQDEHQKL